MVQEQSAGTVHLPQRSRQGDASEGEQQFRKHAWKTLWRVCISASAITLRQ